MDPSEPEFFFSPQTQGSEFFYVVKSEQIPEMAARVSTAECPLTARSPDVSDQHVLRLKQLSIPLKKPLP